MDLGSCRKNYAILSQERWCLPVSTVSCPLSSLLEHYAPKPASLNTITTLSRPVPNRPPPQKKEKRKKNCQLHRCWNSTFELRKRKVGLSGSLEITCSSLSLQSCKIISFFSDNMKSCFQGYFTVYKNIPENSVEVKAMYYFIEKYIKM